MDNKKELNIIGIEGNAFNILAKARRIALKNNMNWDKIKTEAKGGDYENLINVMTKYFKVK